MTKRIALLTLLSCLLAACGNKGPLVLPDAPAPAETPADAPSDTPAAPAAEPPAGDDAGTPATRP
jgi:predicted small lipoprotein YifL